MVIPSVVEPFKLNFFSICLQKIRPNQPKCTVHSRNTLSFIFLLIFQGLISELQSCCCRSCSGRKMTFSSYLGRCAICVFFGGSINVYIWKVVFFINLCGRFLQFNWVNTTLWSLAESATVAIFYCTIPQCCWLEDCAHSKGPCSGQTGFSQSADVSLQISCTVKDRRTTLD